MSDGQPDKNNYKENSDGSKVNNSEKLTEEDIQGITENANEYVKLSFDEE